MLDPHSLVTAIVPAYNEAPTVGAVVETLAGSGLFRDVIVVSDGSGDDTAKISKMAGASYVHQFPNRQGKGAALQHGVTHAETPLLFFCDADLLGLRAEHLRALIEPVASGRLDMCVGLRDRGALWTGLERFLPLIGGERVLRREMFERIPDRYLHGFMVETALNRYCRAHHLKVGTRSLPGLHIRRKMQKVGFWRGAAEYAGMSWQILHAYAVTWWGSMSGKF